MDNRNNRRQFLKGSVAASAGVSMSVGFEDNILLAQNSLTPETKPKQKAGQEFPMGKIGNLQVSRLLLGGNLTSGIAHSRDLHYVSPLLRNYFTDEKIFETWETGEECGLNTAILRLDDQVIRLVNKYWNDRGGKLQWIVQIKPKKYDLEHFKTDIKRAVDNGAVGAYVQGNVSDKVIQQKHVEVLAEALQCIKDSGVVAGIGAHAYEVPVACEKAGLKPDFYLKTLHSPNYWTYNPGQDKWGDFHVSCGETHDNVWCTKHRETIEFMKTVKAPWIAFKVMAAGAIHPKKAFQYVFDNGADFICAGMFDFQVREDVIIAKDILTKQPSRERPWYG